MEPRAPDQPFVCDVCHLNFSNGKALTNHMKDKHEPKWTIADRTFLKSIRITVEDE